jgi:hypothetical protein
VLQQQQQQLARVVLERLPLRQLALYRAPYIRIFSYEFQLFACSVRAYCSYYFPDTYSNRLKIGSAIAGYLDFFNNPFFCEASYEFNVKLS